MKNLLKYLIQTIKKEKTIIAFTFIIFVLGLIFGSCFTNLITKSDKELLINQLTLYMNNISKLSSDVFGIKVFFSELLNNGVQLTIIFTLGISMIGVFVVILILFFKGFILGVTISTIMLKYSFKGILLTLFYIFPVMIFNILIYIFLSFFAIWSSIKFLKALFKKDNLNFKQFLGKYLLSFILSILSMVLLCLLDAFLTPLALKLFTLII